MINIRRSKYKQNRGKRLFASNLSKIVAWYWAVMAAWLQPKSCKLARNSAIFCHSNFVQSDFTTKPGCSAYMLRDGEITMSRLARSAKLLAPALLFSLAACATPFRADVSRFQALPAPQGQTFAVVPTDPEKHGGLEFAQYAGLVAAEMERLGYVRATSDGAADLTVTLDYKVDDGKERTVVDRDPFYDPWWGFGRHGGFYSRPYVVRTRHGYRYIYGWNDPFLFGGAGFGGGYDVRSFTVFTSGIDLKISRTETGERLFEGKAEAKSRSNKLSYLVPNLVEAMFTGFPGNSGETLRISVAPEKK